MKNLKSYLFLILIFNLISNFSSGQLLKKNWLHHSSSVRYESITSLCSNRGSIYACESVEEKTNHFNDTIFGNSDILITKLNSNGNPLFVKRIKANDDDGAVKIRSYQDFLYVLSTSKSGVFRDKTENSYGGSDLWLIKLDTLGNIVDQKTIGSADSDRGIDLLVNEKGVFILSSTLGSISGLKSETSRGNTDIWIIKCSLDLQLLSQKTLGTSAYDDPSALAWVDNQLVVGSSTDGGIEGDKTVSNFGFTDIWLILLDENLTNKTQKTFGGIDGESFQIELKVIDNYLLLAVDSQSGISGNKITNNYSSPEADTWLIRLNKDLTSEWQLTLGGSKVDYPTSILELSNGQFIISSNSFSDISGSRTIPLQGNRDELLYLIDQNGKIVSEFSFGGSLNRNGLEMANTLIEEAILIDENIVFCGLSDASNSGLFNYKNSGDFDGFICSMRSDILATELLKNTTTVNVYPNPSEGFITIQHSFKEVESIEIITLDGKNIMKHSLYDSSHPSIRLNISTLSEGAYLLNLNDSSGNSIHTQKLLKK